MGTITLKNFRTTADVTMNTRLKDSEVFIDWAGLTNIKAWLYSDAQKAIAGRCDVTIDPADSTKLVCEYSANKPQYLGVQRLVIQAKYMGRTKTYDKVVFNFVPRTEGQEGTEIVMDDPVVDVEIDVQEVTSSILDNILAACVKATAEAWEIVDTHRGPAGVTDAEASVDAESSDSPSCDVSVEHGLLSLAFHGIKGKKGDTGNGVHSVEQTQSSEESEGENVVTVTMTDGTQAQFSIRNGHQGKQGTQGPPGVANAKYKEVETLPEAGADTMDFIYLTPSGTAGVYDMSYTERDGDVYAWKPLGTTAIQLSEYAKESKVEALDEEFLRAGEPIEVDAAVSSWTLDGDGLCSKNNDGRLRKYQVVGGQYVYLKLSADTAGVYQFQSAASVPSSGTNANLVGDPVTVATDAYVKVPDGASYLIVSELKTNTTNEVKTTARYSFAGLDGRINNTDGNVAELDKDVNGRNDDITSSIGFKQRHGSINYSTGLWSGTSESADANYFVSDTFLLKKGKTITISGASFSNNFIMLFYSPTGDNLPIQDADSRQFFPLVAVNGSTSLVTKTFTARADMYVIVQAGKNSGGLISGTAVVVSDAGIANEVKSVDVTDFRFLANLKQRYGYIDAGGNWGYSASSAYRQSDTILLKKGQCIEVKSTLNNSNYQLIYVSPTADNIPVDGSETRSFKRVSASAFVDGWKRFYAEEDTYVVIQTGSFRGDYCSLATELYLVNGGKNDDIGVQITLEGRGNSSPVGYGVSLDKSKKYRLTFVDFESTENRLGYTVASLVLYDDSWDSSVQNYYSTTPPPREIFITGKIRMVLNVRAESGTYPRFIVEEVDADGVFSFNDFNGAFTALENMRKTISSSGKTPLVLLHFSDIHADVVNLSRIIDFRNRFPYLIDDVLHTGDSVQDTVDATSFDFWGEVPGADKILNCIGNHDIWYESGYTPSENYPYETYIAPYVETWGAVVPEGASSGNKCYYYKDFAEKGIRLVVIDYSDASADAIAWFSDVLADAITQNLAVVCAVHYTPSLADNFKTGFNYDTDVYGLIGGGIASGYTGAVDTFMTNGGKFFCWLCGHQHADYCGAFQGVHKQVVISVDCAALRNDSTRRFRYKETRSQDAFNIVAFNVNKMLINVYRIGNDCDSMMRHIGRMCIDAENAVLLNSF